MAIVVRDLEYSRPGGRLLFTGISFRVGDGEHAALVGINGIGKSTLLRVIAGELEAGAGFVQVDGRVRFMQQQIGQLGGATTVWEFMAGLAAGPIQEAAPELLAANRAFEAGPTDEAGMRLADAIAHWSAAQGYEEEASWDRCTAAVLGQSLEEAGPRPVRELSGGEQKRLALEMLLTSDAGSLLLDEPDNFLDLAGKRWLEERLRESPKTILLVSHDREVLAATAHRVVTIEGSGAWVHGGSFNGYAEARDARNVRLEGDLGRWRDEERRLYRHYKWMKQRAKLNSDSAGAANAAETRWKKFVEAGPPEAPPKDQRINMRLTGADSGRKVLDCERLELTRLVKPFDLAVTFGERIAILGRNGTGKSHFLRLVAGEPVEHTGSLKLGARVRAGLFNQTHDHGDWQGRTPLELLGELESGQAAPMALLARYGLQGCAEQAFATLSGGQQARLQVLILEREGCNLLLLDEPTDNLDLESADALDQALVDFNGTVVAVTHDRWFMRSFERHLLFDHAGNVSESDNLESLVAVLSDGSQDRPPSGARLLSGMPKRAG